MVTLCDVLTASADAAATVIYADTWNDPDMAPSSGELALALVMVFGGLGMIASFIAGVAVFCCWQYRVAANARALGAEGMQITPGWNVGWWFVPIANLYKPMQAMRENYNASLPDVRVDNWMLRGTPAVIGWWWAAWLIGNFLSQASFRLGMRDDPGLVVASTWFGAASALVSLVAFVAIVRIVQRITAWQNQRAYGEGFAADTRPCPRCGSAVPTVVGAVCPGCALPLPS